MLGLLPWCGCGAGCWPVAAALVWPCSVHLVLVGNLVGTQCRRRAMQALQGKSKAQAPHAHTDCVLLHYCGYRQAPRALMRPMH